MALSMVESSRPPGGAVTDHAVPMALSMVESSGPAGGAVTDHAVPMALSMVESSGPAGGAAGAAAMGAAVFFGCAAIAFGPAAALVLLTVAAEPLRVIVLVAGAFFWLLSLLAASLLWFVSVQLSGRQDAALLLPGAAAAVLLQELCRFACFKLLKKADEGLATLSEDGRSPISLRQMAYVSGLSFGIISGIFSVINILADSAGPGTVGIHGDSPYYFITSAFLTMALVLLHTFWGVIFFDACERRRAGGLGLVVGGHLLVSGLTFLNPWYEASLGPILILTLCTGLWAFSTAGGSFHNVLKCLSCKQEPEGRVMLYSALQVPPEE